MTSHYFLLLTFDLVFGWKISWPRHDLATKIVTSHLPSRTPKTVEKIYRFLKNKYPWYDIYIIVLPTLRGSQKYNFHPYCLTWRARGVQNVTKIDGIFVRVKHDGFYVPFHKMQFLFLFFYVLSNLYLFTYYIVTMTTIILHYEQTKYSIVTLAVLSP